MTSQSSGLYAEIDPAKKTPEWANTCINILRRDWRRLVNPDRILNDRLIMFSMNELTEIRESFQDEDFKKNTKFLPLPILEAMVNSIVEEIMKNPPKAELRATDPSAINEKKADLLLLRNRGIYNRDVNAINQQTKMPPSRVGYEEFNGNVEEFDKMGLNENDPEDLNFYEEHYQRLHFEIAGQQLLINIIRTNQFDEETIRKLVKDIFACKAISLDAYVSRITGEIKWEYLDPSICYGIFGNTNDGKKDICRGWENSVTVLEFLNRVGNEFDWNRDWRYLLWGINYCSTTRFTGFIRGGVSYDCCQNGTWVTEMGLEGAEQNFLDFSLAYTYKVYMGRIQWKTPEATGVYVVNPKDSSDITGVPYSYELKKKQIKEGYEKECYYQEQWYESYFIATSSTSQWIYGFQKLYYQQLEGANDEYANGTLCYYQEEGKSATEIAKTYLQVAHYAFYHMLWLIYKAKPDEDEYLLDEMLTLAKGLKRDFPQATGGASPTMDTILNQVIAYNRKNHVRIRTYPEIEGRKQAITFNEKQKGSGGLDPLTVAMQTVTQWAEVQIGQKIGFNPMRLGANPPSRESTTSEENTIQYSFNTTGYMYRMVQFVEKHLATVSLIYAQDILKYKDSIPYKWIRTIMGDESFENLKILDKVCAHRFGIFIRDYNIAFEKQRLNQAADMALQQKTITIDQWGVVTQTEDPKRGLAILARMERQKNKRERRQAVQDMQMQNEMAQAQHDRMMQQLMFERETEWGKADRAARATIMSSQLQAQSRIDVKNIQAGSEPEKIAAKTEGQKEVEREKQNLKEQQSLMVEEGV